MTTTINGLAVRRALGRGTWLAPREFGPDGWALRRIDGTQSIIVSAAAWDGVEWVHSSIAGHDRLPTYADLVHMHRAIYGDGYAYQVFTPPKNHISIHAHALHLWGRADGQPVLPEFGALGTI